MFVTVLWAAAGVTCHFIVAGVLHKVVLDIALVNFETHNAVALKATLEKILER